MCGRSSRAKSVLLTLAVACGCLILAATASAQTAPKSQFAFDGEHTFASRFTVGLGIFAVSGWYVDQSNAASVDGYALVNPRLSYQLGKAPGRAELVFQVRNLLNSEYIAFTEPDPDGNSYQPVPTREAFAGVRIRLGR